MMDALAMGKYGVYVWGSYGAFALFLLWDLLLPRWRERRVLRNIRMKSKRDAARSVSRHANRQTESSK